MIRVLYFRHDPYSEDGVDSPSLGHCTPTNPPSVSGGPAARGAIIYW